VPFELPCKTVKICEVADLGSLIDSNNGIYVFFFAGARCVSTLLNEMKRRGKDCRFGVISMCIGT